ncbi:MAG: 16S rRNA (guanine(527)-N(7))-methyltransferase RsmG [Alphaproteobacteria bacterium]|nr:16S rRNA (guanine(527)-N(7))-methyltransferase RsmG [Alphaproteobacteria bacterium]
MAPNLPLHAHDIAPISADKADYTADIGFEAFQDLIPVSRETWQKFEVYIKLLLEAQQHFNLIAPSTIPQLWRRHLLDSAQLWPLIPPGTRSLLDFGSGAGFPGLVLSIMGVPDVRLAEGNTHKAQFLQQVGRELGLSITVMGQRFNQLPPQPADVITARALAPLDDLLALVAPFRYPGSRCLFPKGRGYQSEIHQANQRWDATIKLQPSLVHQGGVILVIDHYQRRKKAPKNPGGRQSKGRGW